MYDIKNYPWIFRINISLRTNWFKLFWSIRGANFFEIQLIIFKIQIGIPWHEEFLQTHLDLYKNLDKIRETNDGFLKHNKIATQIKKYDKRK